MNSSSRHLPASMHSLSLLLLIISLSCVSQTTHGACGITSEQGARLYRTHLLAKLALKQVVTTTFAQASSPSELTGVDGVEEECYPGRKYAARLLEKYTGRRKRGKKLSNGSLRMVEQNNEDEKKGDESDEDKKDEGKDEDGNGDKDKDEDRFIIEKEEELKRRRRSSNFERRPYIGNPGTAHIVSAVRTGKEFKVSVNVEQKLAVCASEPCNVLRAVRPVRLAEYRDSQLARNITLMFSEDRGIHGWERKLLYMDEPNHDLKKRYLTKTRDSFKCAQKSGFPSRPAFFAHGSNFCFLSKTIADLADKSSLEIDEFYEVDTNPDRIAWLRALNGEINYFSWIERQHFVSNATAQSIAEAQKPSPNKFSLGGGPANRTCFWNVACSCNSRKRCRKGKGMVQVLSKEGSGRGMISLAVSAQDIVERELSTLLTDPSGASNVTAPLRVTNYEIILSQVALVSLELWMGHNEVYRSRSFHRTSTIIWALFVNVFSLVEIVPVAFLLRQESEAADFLTGNSRVQIRAITGEIKNNNLLGRSFANNYLSIVETNWVFRYTSTRLKLLIALLALDVLVVVSIRAASMCILHQQRRRRRSASVENGIQKEMEAMYDADQ